MDWISVKDRLPEKGESVGYTFDGKDIRHDVYLDRSTNKWEYDNSLSYIIEVEITHWMPLPPPPKDD